MANNYWKGRKVLVTGAGGFIGSHVVEALLLEDASVKVFVRYTSRGTSGLLHFLPVSEYAKLEIIRGDLRDSDAVDKAMQDISHVFHLGALIAIPYSYVHPAEVVETNILGTLNILQAARSAGVERVVHTSSSEVYGSALHVPIDENHSLQGQSPYSASKIGADKIAESYYCAFDLPVVTLRPFNTYGPRQSARAIIPSIITQAAAGGEVRIGNLDSKRDFTYVSDTVQGFLKIAEKDGIEGGTFNLGTGREVSMRELAQKIFQIMGKSPKMVIEEDRLRPPKSEVERLLSDNRLAKEVLDWEPRVSLEEGLEKTIDWISGNLHLYQTSIYQI